MTIFLQPSASFEYKGTGERDGPYQSSSSHGNQCRQKVECKSFEHTKAWPHQNSKITNLFWPQVFVLILAKRWFPRTKKQMLISHSGCTSVRQITRCLSLKFLYLLHNPCKASLTKICHPLVLHPQTRLPSWWGCSSTNWLEAMGGRSKSENI